MLKSVEWGEFKLDDLFTIVGTKSLDSNAVEFVENGVNFVGRTFENNGIQGRIDVQKFKPNEPFTITATVIGNYKYVKFQTQSYYCSQNINKLSPNLKIKKWNKYIAYFFIAHIQRFVSIYDGQQGGYKLDDIKNHKIKIPTKNNQPDYDFMQRFIEQLEQDYIQRLDGYLEVTGLKNTELTEAEQDVLVDFENWEWGEFKVIDIFNVKNTGNILSRDIVPNSGNTPYLCASAENNAVSSYISYNENYLDKGDCIFIGGKTFVVTYQEKDFFSNDSHNLTLALKDTQQKTKFNQFFLATCVNKSLGYKYSWGDSISNRKIQKDVMTLPTTANQPDYTKMELLISAIQKLAMANVVGYVSNKLSA